MVMKIDNVQWALISSLTWISTFANVDFHVRAEVLDNRTFTLTHVSCSSAIDQDVDIGCGRIAAFCKRGI